MYHRCRAVDVAAILRDGLLPDQGRGAGVWTARPGCVYLAAPWAGPLVNVGAGQALLAVETAHLDPALLSCDEDHALSLRHADGAGQGITWHDLRAAGAACPAAWTDTGASLGSWAHAHDALLDAPALTAQSLRHGTVAHRGPVPAAALQRA